MYSRVFSCALSGVEAIPVIAEADISSGMPSFQIVGNVSGKVREAQNRIRTSLRRIDLSLPPRRITINLAPGGLFKDGTRFDLAMAAAVLAASGRVPGNAFRDSMILGELMLDGTCAGVNGILPSVLTARKEGIGTCLVPMENLAEARVTDGIRCVGIRDMQDLLDYAVGRLKEAETGGTAAACAEAEPDPVDFADLAGQEILKRACVISAAGFHNILFSGSPGTGKSMAARRLATILPELTREEQLEVSQIHSIAGLLPKDGPLMKSRPYRAPHHSITASALCGGGLHPKPGEITLAHRGVLFLDELPEMRRETLEMLRQPLEEHEIVLSRVGGRFRFPARFLLAAAMNPCPCGYYPDRNRCSCTEGAVRNYRNRISHALLDRFDLFCHVDPVSYEMLTGQMESPESSAKMRERVVRACGMQKERFRNREITFNSEISAPETARYCVMTADAERTMQTAFRALEMSARAYHRVLRTARTIADLEGEDHIHDEHIREALCYRGGIG